MKAKLVAFHVFWRGSRTATSPPFEEVRTPHVFEAASGGEQGVGAACLPPSRASIGIPAPPTCQFPTADSSSMPHVLKSRQSSVDRHLATANPAALAPTMRRNAVMLADRRRVNCRLLVRQTPQKRRSLRAAELRISCLDRHDALFRSRPEARRPPRAGLRKPVRDRCMLIHKPCRP